MKNLLFISIFIAGLAFIAMSQETSTKKDAHRTSYHAQAAELPQDPKTGFTYIPGVGGMTIGYNEIKGPIEFTPLLKGLPHDLCNTSHWGYIIEGSIKVIYADGKEETFNAGEVYYMPAPHTGTVDKYVKYVEFSPDKEFSVLMEQIAKNVAAAKSTN